MPTAGLSHRKQISPGGCLRTGNEKSTFALSVAAYHVSENVLTFSSMNIISDTVTEI